MEHKTCKGCKWNNYPTCKGTIMDNGNEMNIENLRPIFKCGQKDLDIIADFTPKKTRLEVLEERIIELEKLKEV